MADSGEFLGAQEAADILGVSRNTLYVYVGRHGLRSQPVPGSRERRYWKADILRLKHSGRTADRSPGELRRESALTLVTDDGPYYRGRSAIELAGSSSLEEVASILWARPSDEIFTGDPPRTPAAFDQWTKLLAAESSVDRALGLFPRLEQADLRAYDLTVSGMARTGADVVRWMTAIILRQNKAPSGAIHQHIARSLKLDDAKAQVVRRLLVLAADHGFEPAAYAVRAVASTGVSPWRAVMTGLLVVLGRRSGFGRFETMRLFLSELAQGDPEGSVVRRLRDGDPVPGFGSRLYPKGDPRAATLVAHCAEVFPDDPKLKHVLTASAVMLDAKGLQPDFALACMLAGELLGPPIADSLFLIGRSVGWIAHSIEQYAAGEFEHLEGLYLGPLPGSRSAVR
ncbi:citrate synthase [uncultured Sphingomonas sp.]|uniref:citrate synthase n=1 Tax=uncultured Sphingomonas sp. TaxID=158754 RepID=UPI0035CA825B